MEEFENPRKIEVNLWLAKKIGLEAAIFLSELVGRLEFHEARGELETINGKEGYFYLTMHDVEDRTCLSRRNQETAIKDLKKLDLIDMVVKGCPPKRYFAINEEIITNLLNSPDQSSDESQFVGTSEIYFKD